MKSHFAFVAITLSAAFLAHTAQAAGWEDEWTATLDKAKGQTLVINEQANQAFDTILAEFTRQTGVKVESTVMRPSSALARIQTEQQSGQYGWDIWWGGSSNMVNSAAPAGMLEPFEKYMILPEVKDVSNWRDPDFIYGDAGHTVFTHINELNFAVLRNDSVLPDLKITSADALLDPRLKGKVAIRDASVPNFGTFALATILNAKGPDFFQKFMTDQEPKVFENPQQLQSAINRGGMALEIGLESTFWEQCRKDGGCKDVNQLPQFSVAISWGVTVPKNPPHPEAAKAWINWFLSKQGQEFTVSEWAKYNQTGAVSMRKDVAPAPGYEQYLPDFTRAKDYVFVSTEKGSQEINDTIRIFKETTGR